MSEYKDEMTTDPQELHTDVAETPANESDVQAEQTAADEVVNVTAEQTAANAPAKEQATVSDAQMPNAGAENPSDAANPSEAPTDYQPNFILKPAQPVEADAAKTETADMDPVKAETADAAEISEGAKATDEAAPKAGASQAETTGSADTAADDRMTYVFSEQQQDALRNAASSASGDTPIEAAGGAPETTASDSPAAEVLRAAAARAEALKAAARKAEQADPYRRETSELSGDELDDGIHLGSTAMYGANAANAADGAAQGSNAGASRFQGRTATGSYGESGSVNRNGYGGTSASGAYGGAGAGGYGGNGRPAFENPSFDPGQTGRYTDPRDSFRPGASASWSNGEVHRNHQQVKDSIQKQAKQKKQPKPVTLTRRAMALLVAGCLCLSCLFGLGGAALGTTLATQHQATGSAQTTAATTTGGSSSTAAAAGYSLESATGSSMTIKEITAATKNSVVEIRTESVSSDTWMQQYVTEGAGSGVIISEDGYIMTNNHVIEGANKIKVTTADEKEYEATLVGTDENNDVAVVKIDASGLTPATYGNSDQLEVGDLAVAIGNPLGELGGTVTAGIISATDRALSIDGKTLHLLQTDSSINPGNSGGGLFNGDGQLVGLVVAKSSGSDVEGLGFAIPINKAADVAQQLIDKGYVSGQPSTGMTYQEGTTGGNGGGDPFSSFDSIFGGSGSTPVYIYSVNGENAKKAGFQSGDQVYAVDGEEITAFDDLSAIITSHQVGDKVTFTIIRDGVQKNIKLELEEKTASSQNTGDQGQNGQGDQGSNDGDQNQNGQGGQGGPDNGGQNDQNNLPDSDQSQNGQGGGWQQWFNQFF